MTRRRTWMGAAVAAGAIAAGSASGAGVAARTSCDAGGRLVGRTVVYCGPARASLGVFPGAVFRNGSCRSTTVAGVRQFTLKLGARTPNAGTNDGRPYFGLTISGSFSHPTGGGVIAYWKGKRWGGVGVSFRGNARGGSFAASGINGSHGHATGSYRC